jgi:hypothetical protein
VRGAEGRVSSEGKFTAGAKDPDSVVGCRRSSRQYERCFRKIGPAREALHLFRIDPGGFQDHCQRVSEVRRLTENVDLPKGAPHGLSLTYGSEREVLHTPVRMHISCVTKVRENVPSSQFDLRTADRRTLIVALCHNAHDRLPVRRARDRYADASNSANARTSAGSASVAALGRIALMNVWNK